MKKRILGFLSLLLALSLIVSVMPPVSADAAEDTSAVGGVIDSFTKNSSTFTLSEASRIYVVADEEPIGDLLQTVQLAQRQFNADGKEMTIVWGPEDWAKDGDIVAHLDNSSGIAAEGYSLSVTTKAKVTASDVDGLLYGMNMLQKHLRYAGLSVNEAGSVSITGFTAADAPDTVQRAVSLDCGRKYYTKDWICNFIREMSWMGYNTLQFHFSDDSGFRFDLWDKAYYKGEFQPANDFSWVCGSNYTSWSLGYGTDVDQDKFLSTAEVVEILNTAKEYHIEVIPSFDSPSHLDYTTWKFEQNYDSNPNYYFYSTYDQKNYYAKDVNGIINYTNSKAWTTPLKWPYYSAVNVKGAQDKAFIFELYIDIANFFKEYAGSTDFSIGADEVQLSTSNLAYGYSYAWGFSDFVSYINELNTLLNKEGYTVRMYNDFMGSTAYNASNYKFADNIEIMYWNSPFVPTKGGEATNTEPVSYFVNQNRVLYNCIQTNTYYALRTTSSGSDARSVNNRQWTFYHSTEECIWNEWYSADISEHGDLSEDVPDVSAANLGGAYFLIWCDFNWVSTEQQIWNGCYDTSGSGEFYSLRDRMWSNITKMWNWDINDSLSFKDFTTIRDAYGDHPGIGTATAACSQPTTLPAAGDMKRAELADHTALRAALVTKYSSQYYTDASYQTYETAYTNAQTVDADRASTQTVVDAALAALTSAEEALVIRGFAITVIHKAVVNGCETTLRAEKASTTEGSSEYSIALNGIPGYAVDYVVGSTFVADDADNVTGTLQGTTMQDLYVEVWYKSILDTAFLNDLVENSITAQGNYTSDSWTAYQTALANAQSFTPDTTTRQSDVDALAQALSAARTALVVAAPETTVTVEKLTANAYLGKQVGLRITTTPDVASLTIIDKASGNAETLTLCTAQVQTLNNGETVKVWLVYFPADQTGTFTYTISGGNASTEVEITVV